MSFPDAKAGETYEFPLAGRDGMITVVAVGVSEDSCRGCAFDADRYWNTGPLAGADCHKFVLRNVSCMTPVVFELVLPLSEGAVAWLAARRLGVDDT